MPELVNQQASVLADRYRLEREVGRGGMATVYLATDLKHRRPVAVKILHAHLAANVGADRFLREIEIAARLSHPHILTLMDSGSSDDQLFYVMPYVEGESLRGRLNQTRRLPVAEALRIARQVASALAYAHGRGVVHRDIKPENVMLHEGEAVVTDFGIAKAISAGGAGGQSLTQTGTSIGTPAYMSPEQASGEHELDGRSDIYSLGCVVYEMLAGEPPFTGPTAQAVIMRRFAGPAPTVTGVRPEVPEMAATALNRALARDPDERFTTAAEFVAALGEPVWSSTPAGVATVSAPAVGSPAGQNSIAVLPFADMSPQRDQEYFTDGIAEEIINALTKIEALHVASRTSSFAFKGKNEDIGGIGRKLKVATVLEGSVRKAGNRLRVTTQLVKTADGYQLWSERYDRELEDVFAIQDEIAQSIVKALRGVLSDDERKAIERPRSVDVKAYEYYLRGRQFFHQFREKGLQFARRMFDRAIEVDPGFVLAHAGLADCSSFLYMYWDASEANLEQAQTASRRALELGPEVAEAHASRGLALTLSREYEAATREFDTAVRLDPKLFEAHYFYGRANFQQGQFEDAARRFAQASEVRPEDFQAPSLLALAYDSLGRTQDAAAARLRAVETARRHLELNPDDVRALYLGAVDLCAIGDAETSRDWAGRALALDPEDSGVLYNVGCVYAQLGEDARALDCLEKAVENGFGHREWLENDNDLASLRDDPRFTALLSRL